MPDDPESLQSSKHICKRMQQMANEKAATEKPSPLHLTYLSNPTSKQILWSSKEWKTSCDASAAKWISLTTSNSKTGKDWLTTDFQYPTKRNTAKSVILNSTTIPISQNKFSNLQKYSSW
ncbi:hypothetical protein CEXT_800161 [Caerostris extrusa]|uniref:Uncharacterized protein n=1 Tax=Caerostris extrusa TaxID=172846 RepID=A0AAV4TKW5_CAEEX|nr:hypothetical protein CEXT_800161 [Caerostris extrusa]